MNTEANSLTWGSVARKLIPLLALGCVLGCRSTGYEKSDAAALSLNKAMVEVHVVTGDIETTLEMLGSLVNEPAADLKPQYEQFSAALDRLKESVAQTESTRKRM